MQTLIFTRYVLNKMGLYSENGKVTIGSWIVFLFGVTTSSLYILFSFYFAMANIDNLSLLVPTVRAMLFCVAIFVSVALYVIEMYEKRDIHNTISDIQGLVDKRNLQYKFLIDLWYMPLHVLINSIIFPGVRENSKYLDNYTNVEYQYEPLCSAIFKYFLYVIPVLITILALIPLYNFCFNQNIPFILFAPAK